MVAFAMAMVMTKSMTMMVAIVVSSEYGRYCLVWYDGYANCCEYGRVCYATLTHVDTRGNGDMHWFIIYAIVIIIIIIIIIDVIVLNVHFNTKENRC